MIKTTKQTKPKQRLNVTSLLTMQRDLKPL